MRTTVIALVVTLLALAAAAPAAAQAAAKPQEVRLAGTAKWRGSPGDRVELTLREGAVTKQLTGTVKSIDAAKGVITVDVDGGSGKASRPFLASQIVSMKTVSAAPAGSAAKPAGGAAAKPAAGAPATGGPKPSGKKDAQGYDLD